MERKICVFKVDSEAELLFQAVIFLGFMRVKSGQNDTTCYTRKLGVFCLSPPNRLISLLSVFGVICIRIYIVEQMNL